MIAPSEIALLTRATTIADKRTGRREIAGNPIAKKISLLPPCKDKFNAFFLFLVARLK